MDERKGDSAKELDLAGIVTFGAFLLIASWAMLNGLSLAGREVGLVPAVLLLATLLAAFIIIEMRSTSPAVQIGIFRNRIFGGLALVPFCLAISCWSLVMFIPICQEDVFQIGAQQSACILLAFTLSMFAVPYWVTGVATRWPEAKVFSCWLVPVAAGCLVIAIGAHRVSYAFSIAGMILADTGAAAMQTRVSDTLIAFALRNRLVPSRP